MQARLYDPFLGQFISVDPLADKYPGWGAYVYCANNPLKYIDPTGEWYYDTFGDLVWQKHDDEKTLKTFYDEEGVDYEQDDLSKLFANLNEYGHIDVVNVLIFLSKSKDAEKNLKEYFDDLRFRRYGLYSTEGWGEAALGWVDGYPDLTSKFNNTLKGTYSFFEEKRELFEKGQLPSGLVKLSMFASQVGNNKPFDIKQPGKGYSPEEIGDTYAYYKGNLFRFDDFGNYNFGYAASTLGISLEMSLFGAGVNQVLKGNADWSNWKGFFDHSQDTEYIIKGYYHGKK